MPTEPTRPARVVIAEDEAIIRLDLKELLQEEGYDVVGETGRGDEAIELVRDLRPDLVILDIKMPGLDGLSAARQIATDRLAAVLMVTAFSQRELVEQARDAGALAYLVVLLAVAVVLVRGIRAGSSNRARLCLLAILAALAGHVVTDSFMSAEVTGSWLAWMLMGAGVAIASRTRPIAGEVGTGTR